MSAPPGPCPRAGQRARSSPLPAPRLRSRAGLGAENSSPTSRGRCRRGTRGPAASRGNPAGARALHSAGLSPCPLAPPGKVCGGRCCAFGAECTPETAAPPSRGAPAPAPGSLPSAGRAWRVPCGRRAARPGQGKSGGPDLHLPGALFTGGCPVVRAEDVAPEFGLPTSPGLMRQNLVVPRAPSSPPSE